VPSSNSVEDNVSIADLDDHARKQWEAVLGYMVGSTVEGGVAAAGSKLGTGVTTLLKMGGLVNAKAKVEITTDGFAFILQEVNAQVWTILILYLQNAESVRTILFFGL
jgi:transcription initiation factor TFIIH subunit 4